MKSVTIHDFAAMTGPEREAYFFTVIGMTKRDLAEMIAEFEVEEGKRPNALFLSAEILAKIPVRIKKALGLTVIPYQAKPDQFVISQVDPWDQRWEHLFYS